MKSKKQQAKKHKNPQEAPDSIANKKESTKYKLDNTFLRRNTKNMAIPDIKVPDLALKGISEFNEFDLGEIGFQDYFAQEEVNDKHVEILKNDTNIPQDDINHFVDPIEFVKNFNVSFFKSFYRNKNQVR